MFMEERLEKILEIIQDKKALKIYEMILTIKVIFVKVKDRKSKEQKRLKGCFRELMVGENQDRTFMRMVWELLSWIVRDKR